MKAWRISSFGIENLASVDLPMPQPGPGQVLVKIHAASLNYRDLMMVVGKYNPKMTLPRIPFSDGAGEIAAIGEGISSLKAGNRVAGIFMQNWVDGPSHAAKQKGALGGDLDGMLAEYVVLPETGVVLVPAHLSWEEASTLPCAGLTAWNAVVRSGNLQPGSTVLIQGTGGVSIFALQFAKLLGARVLGTSSSDEKLHRAEELGLDAGLNYRATPDWASWATEQTNGEGVDLVVEVGGSGTFSQSLRAARVGGTITQIGVLSQTTEPLQIGPLLHKQLHIQGIYVGSRTEFLAMNRAIARNQLRPVVDEVFSFNESKKALERMQSGHHFGKLVIRVQ